jgi:nucleotide-binding universal stress UspA family protein
VVGVDGTEGALDAVAWAAREADLRHLPLRIVHAFAWPLLHVPTASWRSDHESTLQSRSDRLLAEAVDTALSVSPGADVSTAVETDFPLPLLVTESTGSTYVVVGTGGPPALAEAFVGSMTGELANRAKCPVVVVRRTPAPEIVDDLVVVGVDGSALGALAVELGAEEAARRGGRLLAVHVVRHGWSSRLGGGDTSTGLRLLEESLAGSRERFPDLRIEERVASGHVADVLVGLSGRASLLVVGARGRGGLAGLVVGSVTQTLLHRAQCPVLVLCRDRVAQARPYVTAQRFGGRSD